MTSVEKPTDPASNVSGVQPIAQDILRQVAGIYRNHLGPDLHSLVAHGSAVKGGLIIGSSDVDYMVFVTPGILTTERQFPLDSSLALQRDLARIDIAPFRYVQGKVYPRGSGPETGFIPGTYQVVTGSPDIPIATNRVLMDAAARDLARLDLAAIRDRISNAMLDHGEGRLSRQVRLLCTWIWPTMFQVATLHLGNGLTAWQHTKPEIVALLGHDPEIGPPLRSWMEAITHHHAIGESTSSALDAIAAGVAFLETASTWFHSHSRTFEQGTP